LHCAMAEVTLVGIHRGSRTPPLPSAVPTAAATAAAAAVVAAVGKRPQSPHHVEARLSESRSEDFRANGRDKQELLTSVLSRVALRDVNHDLSFPHCGEIRAQEMRQCQSSARFGHSMAGVTTPPTGLSGLSRTGSARVPGPGGVRPRISSARASAESPWRAKPAETPQYQIDTMEARISAALLQLQQMFNSVRADVDEMSKHSKGLEAAFLTSDQQLTRLEQNLADVDHRQVNLTTAFNGALEEQRNKFDVLQERLNVLEGSNFEERFRALEDQTFGRNTSIDGPGSCDERRCSAMSDGTRQTVDEALLVVNDLDESVHQELQGVHRRLNALQGCFDERVLVPLRRLEQRFSEQDSRANRIIEDGQDHAARVEEHEIRLSVVRTKLEVHDQKLAQLDRSVRWRGTDTERSSPASPAHVAAQHKPRAAHELVGDGALGFDNVRAEVLTAEMPKMAGDVALSLRVM